MDKTLTLDNWTKPQVNGKLPDMWTNWTNHQTNGRRKTDKPLDKQKQVNGQPLDIGTNWTNHQTRGQTGQITQTSKQMAVNKPLNKWTNHFKS